MMKSPSMKRDQIFSKGIFVVIKEKPVRTIRNEEFYENSKFSVAYKIEGMNNTTLCFHL